MAHGSRYVSASILELRWQPLYFGAGSVMDVTVVDYVMFSQIERVLFIVLRGDNASLRSSSLDLDL